MSLTGEHRVWQARLVIRTTRVPTPWWVGLGLLLTSCGTVELGENIVQPNTQLSEDYFYCFIQPDVIGPAGCATGMAGDTGGCHQAQSSLRLIDAAAIARPSCTGDMDHASMVRVMPGAVIPPEYIDNFQRVQFTLGPDAESSPFYRRPTMMDSHPRRAVDAAQEQLILNWFGSAL
jgi:hypothetical protein